MPGMTLSFTDLNDGQVRRLLNAVNATHDAPQPAGGPAPVEINPQPAVPTAATPASPEKALAKRAKKDKPEPAGESPEPTASAPGVVATTWPLGGPIPSKVDLAEVRRRAVLFMEHPMGGGELFGKRLEAAGSKNLSGLPEEQYASFIASLLPDTAAVESKPASLLD